MQLPVKFSCCVREGESKRYYLRRSNGPVAQGIEHLTSNLAVAGSKPAGLTFALVDENWLRHFLFLEGLTGAGLFSDTSLCTLQVIIGIYCKCLRYEMLQASFVCITRPTPV